jgi:hypothetical protein
MARIGKMASAAQPRTFSRARAHAGVVRVLAHAWELAKLATWRPALQLPSNLPNFGHVANLANLAMVVNLA